jgi:hypothetical protein
MSFDLILTATKIESHPVSSVDMKLEVLFILVSDVDAASDNLIAHGVDVSVREIQPCLVNWYYNK